MNRKQKIAIICTIAIICVILVSTIVTLLYHAHTTTHIEINLEAVQLDEAGNEIDTAQIHISGQKLDYRFQKDCLELEIDSFDNLTDFKVALSMDSFDDLSSLETIRINGKSVDLDRQRVDALDFEYWSVSFRGQNDSTSSKSAYELIFTKEFDCFAFWNRPLNGGESTWYIVSLSGNYTTREIIEHFKGLVPGY